MGLSVAEATKAWCMRRKRGEFFRAFVRLGWVRLLEVFEAGLFLTADAEGLVVACGIAAAGASGVCATIPVTHTDAINTAAKRGILRKCPATSSNYRRKLLPRRDTSSSARLRISS